MSTHNINKFGNFGTLASQYWDAGYSVLPLEPNEKRPAKQIKGWSGFSSNPPGQETRRGFLDKYADRGIGLPTGTGLGGGYRLGAIDVDQDRFVGVAKIILGGAPCAKLGKKGLTIFTRYQEDLRSTSFQDSVSIVAMDALLGGKLMVLPPSLHPHTGRPYRWVGTPLLETTFDQLPLLTREKLNLLKLVVGSEYVSAITAGDSTHDAGVAFVGQLVAHGCDDAMTMAIFEALLPKGYDGNSLKELPEWVASARCKGFHQPKKSNSRESSSPSPAEILAEDLKTLGVSLCRNERENTYMSVPTPTGGSLTYALQSSLASAYLRRRYYEATKKSLKDNICAEVIALLDARARFDSRCEKIHNRIGRDGDSIVIDRGTNDGSVVRITPHGFSVEVNSPIRFVRTPDMGTLPEPRRGGDITRLKRLLGLSDDAFTLILAFLINALRPDGPYLCLLVEGEQGSGKSFLSTVLRRLIDPHEGEKIRLPDKERDLMVLASALFLLVFDNCSGMKADISDTLCVLATGGGYASRKLYTDGELYFMKASRPFIINGISDIATKSDLIERLIPIELERMYDEERRTEAEINAELEFILPELIGALYDAVACALRNEAETETPRGIRMADATRWIQAAEPATGLPQGTFLRVLERCQEERIIERTRNDLVVTKLMDLLDTAPFEGTLGDLLELIKMEYTPRYYPDTPQKLSKHLDRQKTGMKLVGIHFERLGRSNKGVEIKLWRDGQENDGTRGFMPPDTPI